MAFHGGAQVPLEGALVIAFNAQAHGIHDADQFLGIGVAGAGRGQELGHGFLEPVAFHQHAAFFDLGSRGEGQH
jgi:cytochrome c peroxidase